MNRVAVVTGASRGIGRATALLLARSGYRVFALARSGDDLNALSTEAARHGWTVEPVVMDISDETSRQAAARHIFEATGGYGADVLINNAGYGQMGPLEEVSPQKLARQLDVNVVSLLAFTQPFLPGMRERHLGWIVNLSSAAGRVATPFMGAYNASKFALEGMSDALRLELSPFGVHVILIEPGPIPTHFGRVADQEDAIQPDSPYAPYYQRYQGADHTSKLFSRSAETVARVILRAVSSNRPRARYTVTPVAKLATFGRALPDFVRDWGIRLGLGLHET